MSNDPYLPYLPDPYVSRPADLNFDQSVDFVSDQFEIALNDSVSFRERIQFDTIRTGLVDPYDPYFLPVFVENLVGGIVDEHELHVKPNSMTSVIRGRDAAARAADTTVYVTYAVNPNQLAPHPQSIPGFPALPFLPGVTTPLILYGRRRASDIAKDLCTRVGLTCVWDTYDYTLREDVVVNGPILSTLQQLIEPFSHFERSKVDIWAEGEDTLIIRSRGRGGPGFSVSAHDLRCSDLVIRAKFNGYVRVLRIIGSATGSNDGVAVDPGNRTEVLTEEFINPSTGGVMTRIVTTSLVRILDNAQLAQTVETFKDTVNDDGSPFSIHLVSLKETVSDWDDLSLVFPNTIVNQPKEHSRVITESVFDPSNPNVLAPGRRTSIGTHYDDSGYLTGQDTRNETWDTTGSGKWVLESSETKQYQDNGAGQIQITTTQFGSDGIATDCRRTTANGTRPGGPGRNTGVSNVDSDRQITRATLISLAPSAKDVTISNRSLLLPQMTVIAQQATDWSGGTEVEICATLAQMPWIRRGMYITITGLFAEDGVTEIVLQPALISESRIEIRGSQQETTALTYIKALYWELAP